MPRPRGIPAGPLPRWWFPIKSIVNDPVTGRRGMLVAVRMLLAGYQGSAAATLGLSLLPSQHPTAPTGGKKKIKRKIWENKEKKKTNGGIGVLPEVLAQHWDVPWPQGWQVRVQAG